MLDPLAIRVDKMLQLAQVASLRDNRRESWSMVVWKASLRTTASLRTNGLRLMSFVLRLSHNQLQRMRQ